MFLKDFWISKEGLENLKSRARRECQRFLLDFCKTEASAGRDCRTEPFFRSNVEIQYLFCAVQNIYSHAAGDLER